ncbi:beta-galactosidase [candidate division KSB1 bacterium]|nr:beta-galactosidase [candidate division KSB1 bacterium]
MAKNKKWRFALLILAFIFSKTSAQPKPFDTYAPDGSMYIGVDYYPEHWPEERWATDIKLMKEAGFNVVRLAEFSWAKLEPREGVFDFAWLDRIMQMLAENDIYVILGTPTAVMPAWCAKYPETLAMKADGTRIVWGGRKNNCFSSSIYRQLSRRITRAMAEHYKGAANLVGWQTDNEFGSTDCRCNLCRAEFQQWLQNKYKTLTELNRAWGTHFWGLTFASWDEIPIPDDREGPWAISNPGASLDWMRFTSWLNVRFQDDQIKILREYHPDKFITHNFMGLYQNMDYYDLAKNLDVVSWDNYPTFGDDEEIHIPYSSSLAADVMRGLKGGNFWIMEQTAGPHGWASFGRNVRPGELAKICLQQLAHGADAQIWFRWRTCTAGREQYWHGLLGHDGLPLRRYEEAKGTASAYRKLEKELRGTSPKNDIAFIYDYDSMWALRIQPGYPGNSYQAAISRYYNALFRAGATADMIPPSADFSKYKIVFAPDLHILPDDVATRLDAFVKNGGILVTDCRTGVKDATGLAHARTLPGLLSPALGIRIEEYEAIPTELRYPVKGELGDFQARSHADWVIAEDASVVAHFETPWHMTGFSAVSQKHYGAGQGWYIGTVFEGDEFYDTLVKRVLAEANISPIITPPAGVETAVREDAGKKLLFIINHTDEAQVVDVPAGKVDLLTGRKSAARIDLDRFGVAVLKL